MLNHIASAILSTCHTSPLQPLRIMRSAVVAQLSSSANHSMTQPSASSPTPIPATSSPAYYLPNVIPMDPISLQQFGLIDQRFDSFFPSLSEEIC